MYFAVRDDRVFFIYEEKPLDNLQNMLKIIEQDDVKGLDLHVPMSLKVLNGRIVNREEIDIVNDDRQSHLDNLSRELNTYITMNLQYDACIQNTFNQYLITGNDKQKELVKKFWFFINDIVMMDYYDRRTKLKNAKTKNELSSVSIDFSNNDQYDPKITVNQLRSLASLAS